LIVEEERTVLDSTPHNVMHHLVMSV